MFCSESKLNVLKLPLIISFRVTSRISFSSLNLLQLVLCEEWHVTASCHYYLYISQLFFVSDLVLHLPKIINSQPCHFPNQEWHILNYINCLRAFSSFAK